MTYPLYLAGHALQKRAVEYGERIKTEGGSTITRAGLKNFIQYQQDVLNPLHLFVSKISFLKSEGFKS